MTPLLGPGALFVLGSGAAAVIRAGGKTVRFTGKERFGAPGKNGIARCVYESITTHPVGPCEPGSEPPPRIELKLE